MEKSVFNGKVIKVTTEPKKVKNTKVVFERAYLGDSVHIFPILLNGKIRLIRERKLSNKGETVTKLISGRVEKREKPLACARREMREELGLTAKKWKLFKTAISTGTINDMRYYYIASDLNTVESENDEAEEILGHKDYSITELYDNALKGEYGYSPSALVIIQLYQKRKQFLLS